MVRQRRGRGRLQATHSLWTFLICDLKWVSRLTTIIPLQIHMQPALILLDGIHRLDMSFPATDRWRPFRLGALDNHGTGRVAAALLSLACHRRRRRYALRRLGLGRSAASLLGQRLGVRALPAAAGCRGRALGDAARWRFRLPRSPGFSLRGRLGEFGHSADLVVILVETLRGAFSVSLVSGRRGPETMVVGQG